MDNCSNKRTNQKCSSFSSLIFVREEGIAVCYPIISWTARKRSSTICTHRAPRSHHAWSQMRTIWFAYTAALFLVNCSPSHLSFLLTEFLPPAVACNKAKSSSRPKADRSKSGIVLDSLESSKLASRSFATWNPGTSIDTTYLGIN